MTLTEGRIYPVRSNKEIIPMQLIEKGRHKYFDKNGNEMPAEKSMLCFTWVPPVHKFRDAWGNVFYASSMSIENFNYFKHQEGLK